MIVKSILPKVKANRLTYYNLDKHIVKDFQKLYAYLKKYQNNEISNFSVKSAEEILKDSEKLGDYLRKYKAMKSIATSIIHK